MRFLYLIVLLICSTCVMVTPVSACTRALYADNNQAVVVGRNMDWFSDLQTSLLVFPRGIPRNGLAKVNPLKWVSKYGSIVTSSADVITTDGMNEPGLSVHMLWLDAASYGKRNPKIPGLSVIMWVQYYLDNFQTVDEAVRYTQATPYQVTSFMSENLNMTIHLAMDDASGDSAVIEVIKGKLNIFHDRAYKVLTNDPVFEGQLANLKNYAGFGGEKPLPGTTAATDRFVRASYYVNHLPKAESTQTAIAYVLSVIQNAAEPFAATVPGQDEPEPTVWRVIADLTHKIYYFNSANSLNIVYMPLNKFDLAPGAPVLKLDILNKPELTGDITKEFHVKPVQQQEDIINKDDKNAGISRGHQS